MNNDLISREALKKDLKQYFTDGVLDGVSAKLVFNQILHDIDNAPTITPEMPHGKWCEMPTKNTDYISIEKHYYCSLCGEQVWGENEKSNYCPHCGADMRGEEE